MNKLEEIQEIIKNFIEEKQQMTGQIIQIENKRMQLANIRNSKKAQAKKINAFTGEVEAEVNALGKEIADLGNQSQELQYKIDSKSIYIKREVTIYFDNQISESIRKIRKIEEIKREIENKVEEQKSKSQKYEIQKNEFFARFGRMPELSENAQKENTIIEQAINEDAEKIKELDIKIVEEQKELENISTTKRNFKNGNYSAIVKVDEIEEQKIKIEIPEEIHVEEVPEIEEQEELSENSLKQIVSLVEDILVEQQEENQKVEEEATVLPFAEEIEVAPIEEIEPIQEVSLEDFEPINEIKVDEIQEVDEPIKIEEIKEENIAPIENIKVDEIKITDGNIKKIEEVEENVSSNEVEKVEETHDDIGIEELIANKLQEKEKAREEEIIVREEPVIKKVPSFGTKIKLLSITAKIENDEVVYIGEVSNGDTIKVYPTRSYTENLILKERESKEEIKEVLINYAVSEYRMFDKKTIKKIDPIVCEVLDKFAKYYNYDAQSLIFNYAMSFSRSEEADLELIPQIIYNFSFIDSSNLNKKEKEILLKMCKNAKKNCKIEIIGYNSGLKKIKYIFKRTFNVNDANALPEGKY